MVILSGSLLTTACASPARDVLSLPTAPTSTVPMGSDFTLAPGESVVMSSSGRNGTNTRDFALETYAPRSQTTQDGLVVKLLGVTPAPRMSDSIPPASYRATLRISRP